MYGDTQSLYIIGPIGPASKVRKVELDLIPTLIESHGHGAYEWLYTSGGLVIRCSKSPSHVFVVQDLHFESEVFFKLNDECCTFLMIMTRKGSLMPKVYYYLAGQVM